MPLKKPAYSVCSAVCSSVLFCCPCTHESASIHYLEQRPLDVSRLRDREHLGMIERLPRERPDRDAPTAVRGRILQHLLKKRPGQMKAAARGIQQPAWSQQTDRAKIDILVTAYRSRQRGPGLGESRWIENDRVESDPFALLLAQIIERVRLD